MPQRFLRPEITNSKRWNSVSLLAESFYVRVLTVVDDFGRTDGRPEVLLGLFLVWNKCHPKQIIKLETVTSLLRELVDAKMIDLYEIEDKVVLQVEQWKERIRENCRAKWPARTNCAAQSCTILPPSPTSTSTPTPLTNVIVTAGLRYPAGATEGFKGQFDKWIEFRKGLGRKPKVWEALFQEQLDWLAKQPQSDWTEIVSQSIRNGWQGLFEVRRNGSNGNHKPEPAWKSFKQV